MHKKKQACKQILKRRVRINHEILKRRTRKYQEIFYVLHTCEKKDASNLQLEAHMDLKIKHYKCS